MTDANATAFCLWVSGPPGGHYVCAYHASVLSKAMISRVKTFLDAGHDEVHSAGGDERVAERIQENLQLAGLQADNPVVVTTRAEVKVGHSTISG